MKPGTKVWFKTSDLSNKPGEIISHIGEGYYYVKHSETHVVYCCFMLDMEPITEKTEIECDHKTLTVYTYHGIKEVCFKCGQVR